MKIPLIKEVLEYNENGVLPGRGTDKHAKLHRVKHLIERKIRKVRKVWRVCRHPLKICV